MVVDDQSDITITLKIALEEDGGFDVDAFTDPELALSSFFEEQQIRVSHVWLLVLLVASASYSFQRVSATTEREACVTSSTQNLSI